MKPYLRDARLWLFVVLAIGASILSSHGAYQFFQYLVSDELALVFIFVVALGIIGLDAAGTLEKGWRAAAYYGGMAFFLVLETLANYFAGQAGFVAQIVAKLPPSSDLRAIAEQSPAVTRMLVVLFLSLASVAVALFTFAATARFQQLRTGQDASLRARFARLFAQRRVLVRALVATLRAERQRFAFEQATLRAGNDEVRAELETVRGQFAQERERATANANRAAQEVTAIRAELETVRAESTPLRAQFAAVRASEETVRAELAKVRTDKETADRQISTVRAELSTVRADLDEARTLAQLDAQSIARSLAADGISMKAIGRALGISDKTAAKWVNEKVEV